MPNDSKTEFLANLKKSGVIDADRLTEWLDVTQAQTAEKLAKYLVRDELLTKWQAKYLLSGRSRLEIASYQLLERTSRDELGDRFSAVHTSLARKVDLQVLSSKMVKDESRCKRFLKKASGLAKLDHPNLVHVYDIDQEGGRYYLVTEHIDGTSLDEVPRSQIKEDDIARILDQALKAITYAHENDIVHGYIKQSDLILVDKQQLKIQNLAVSPFYEDSNTDPKADFKAVKKVAVSLLKEIPEKKRTEKYRDLVKLLNGFDYRDPKSIETTSLALADWVGSDAEAGELDLASADLFSTDGSLEGSFDQPTAGTVGKSLRPKKKSAKSNTDGDQTDQANQDAGEPGFIGRLWQNNPVAFIATSALLGLAMLGGSGFGIYSFFNPTKPKTFAVKDAGDASDKKSRSRVDRENGSKKATQAEPDKKSVTEYSQPVLKSKIDLGPLGDKKSVPARTPVKFLGQESGGFIEIEVDLPKNKKATGWVDASNIVDADATTLVAAKSSPAVNKRSKKGERGKRGGAASAASSLGSILISESDDRSNGMSLDGREVKDDIYVFFEPKVEVEKVTFLLDNSQTHNEGAAPYDLNGGDKSAKPFNTKNLPDGEHSLEAKVTLLDGSTETLSAKFVVVNTGDSKTEIASTDTPDASPASEAAPTFTDLTRISGIGDSMQKYLNQGDVKSINQIASMSGTEIQAALRKGGFFGPSKAQVSLKWIEQAKNIIGDKTPIKESTVATKAPAKKAAKKKEPEVDLSTPFKNFPRVTDLGPITNTNEVEIAPLKINQSYLLGAELICEPGVSKTKLIFEMSRSKEDKQKWMVGVKRRAREKPTLIAMFRKSPDAFFFQWLPEAAENKYAEFLRNCHVKLKTPDDEATFLTLRKPIKIPDLRYTAENMTNQVEIDIPAMPNVENIVIELLQPQVKGLELTPRKIVIEPRQPGTILLSRRDRRDNSGFMWIQIAGDLKPRLQLQSNVMAKYGNQVTAMSSLEDISGFIGTLKQIQAQADAINAAKQQEKAPTGKNNQANRDRINKERSEYEKRAKQAKSLVDKAITYKDIISKAANQPLHVRVYAKFGNLQTQLIQTDAKLPQPASESKKKRKR